ncbi:tetratricopeptide repeat protein [Epibacterium ulvae]|uniref:tetratricopeptide repeat protein n=1 Tax=Epibacterium ulvae TaxID=1156985 RepID=UPI001BFC8136|nr:tetratricopeptide repeat protein [Epibacterium ulvae]MBT8155399.1 tetratricopeptide repeat protein [Epibacterium ulvae]
MRLSVLATLLVLPVSVYAAGEDNSTPPKPTDTVKECWGKRVYDADKGRCVKPEESSLNDEQLYDDVRALAYAGRLDAAQAALAAMSDQNESRVLTYWGFTHRKQGDFDLATQFYQAALKTDPDNLLARSYYGQGLVQEGRLGEAFAQWKEIRTRGGAETWAEVSLRASLEDGRSFSY